MIWEFDLECGIWGPAAIGDLNKDGKVEIVAGDTNGTVYAIKNDGSLLWKHSFPKIYFSHGFLSPHDAEFSPYIADLDGNGYPEIILLAWLRGIFILNHEGKVLKKWSHPLGVIGFEGAAIADIDGDGDLEIIFGKSAGTIGIFGKLGILDQ